MAALCGLGNMEGLIDKVCVARDEVVGVYGFVFHRGETISRVQAAQKKLDFPGPLWALSHSVILGFLNSPAESYSTNLLKMVSGSNV
jgi:hypothetical protein